MAFISSILSKFTGGHERSVKAKKNIAAALVIKGGSILVNLALVPLTINYVSSSDYGIWLTLSSIILWFSYFDIGLGHGLRNKLAEAVAVGNKDLAKTYVSTTYAILTIVVLAIWILFCVGNYFLDWQKILNAPQADGEVLGKVAFLVFTFFCLQFILKLIGTVLTANQQPAKSSLFDFVANLSALVTIFILTRLKGAGSLTELAFITGIFQVLVLSFATVYFFRGRFAYLKPGLKHVNFSYSRPLMGLGVKFFVIQFTGIFIFQCTNIIITQILGPQEVTVYNIAYRYFAIAKMATAIVTIPFWSAFTEAYVKEDFSWMKSIVKKLNLYYLGISVVIAIMYFVSDFGYRMWVGDKVSIPATVSLLMAINLIVTIRWDLFVLLVNGTGKIRLQLLLNVIMSFAFIPIAIYLGRRYGLAGIVFTNMLINLIYAVIIPLQGRKILNQTAKGIWNK